MNERDKKVNQMYTFSYSIPAKQLQETINELEDIKADAIDQLLEHSDLSEANSVIARIKSRL